jgi:hypothetical protein
VVLMHWRRLAGGTWDSVRDQGKDARIERLQRQLTLSPGQARGLDRWTEFCDLLSFHASFGHTASGRARLRPPFRAGPPRGFQWQVKDSRIHLVGGNAFGHRLLSLNAFHGPGYPNRLTPARLPLRVDYAPELGAGDPE